MMSTVVIVGGGPAGCATALALHALGVDGITIVEAGRYQRERVGESVPPDIGLLFARCGINDAFLDEGHEPCVGSCASWGSDGLGYNDFIANPHGPGWHLDRRRFERFLARQVRARGIRLFTNTRFREVERHQDGGYTITVEGPERARTRLRAEWLVDAGGVQALLATRLGARKRIHDQLVVASAFLDLSDNGGFSRLTMLEAVEYGWWYAARLPDGRLIVAVASDAPTLKAMRLNEPEGWALHLHDTRHLATALRSASWPEPKLTIGLAASSILEPCAGAHWLAVGDAASCYDPISAQGIHKAFATGVAAADAIAAHRAGDPEAISAYQRRVRQQFDDYLRNRRYFYDLERRWPSASFWQCRSRTSEKMVPLKAP